MTNIFGGSTSGWMRIAKLEVNNFPQGFKIQIVDLSLELVTQRLVTPPTMFHTAMSLVQFQLSNLDGFNDIHSGSSRNN